MSSMEEDLLSSMLQERDAKISSLTSQIQSTQETLQGLQKQLHKASQLRHKQREEHSSTIGRLKDEHADQRRLLAKFERNIKSGGGLRVHEYAALMRNANQEHVESSYVLRLQAQLCRAMHSLGVMESQLALVKDNCASLIKAMREDLSHMVDDRTRREIELMNNLGKIDQEKRQLEDQYQEKLDEKQGILDQIKQELEESGIDFEEEEIQRAHEAQLLKDKIESTRRDRRAKEKEMLQGILEREEHIHKLRAENSDLSLVLDKLKKGWKGRAGSQDGDLGRSEGDLSGATGHTESEHSDYSEDEARHQEPQKDHPAPDTEGAAAIPHTIVEEPPEEALGEEDTAVAAANNDKELAVALEAKESIVTPKTTEDSTTTEPITEEQITAKETKIEEANKDDVDEKKEEQKEGQNEDDLFEKETEGESTAQSAQEATMEPNNTEEAPELVAAPNKESPSDNEDDKEDSTNDNANHQKNTTNDKKTVTTESSEEAPPESTPLPQSISSQPSSSPDGDDINAPANDDKVDKNDESNATDAQLDGVG